MNWLEERHFKRCPPRYGPRREPKFGVGPPNRFKNLINEYPQTTPEGEGSTDYETIIWHQTSARGKCVQLVLDNHEPRMYIHVGSRYTWEPEDFGGYFTCDFEYAIDALVQGTGPEDRPDMEAVIRAALFRRYGYAARR